MGGGASSPVNKETEVKAGNPVADAEEMMKLCKFDSTNNIDNFAQEMFLRSPKVEGLSHILSSHHGREAFMKFLRTE